MSVSIDIFVLNTRFVNMKGIQIHETDHVAVKVNSWLFNSKSSLKFPLNENFTNFRSIIKSLPIDLKL